MTPGDLEDLLADFDGWVVQHGMDHAVERLERRYPADAATVRDAYRSRIGRPIHGHGSGLIAPDHEAWYLPKPDREMPRWRYAKSKLGLPDPVVERVSEVSDAILARLAAPWTKDIGTRGLVLGHVQSGKTTSFLSVAAKAADSGYDLIIILAGVHNSLRRQTQDRASRTLVHKPELWWQGTKLRDFQPDGNSLSAHLAGNGKRGLLVVKKHPVILEHLADWLESEPDAQLRSKAILVIDDEADQAGLDVGSGRELEGIHKQLMRIVNLSTSDGKRRSAYLAYTATPYANILTSQAAEGLYPKDFIYPLEKPDGYVGSEELFGDARVGSPVQIERADGESDDDELLTPGLRDAVRWFVLATAARGALGGGIDDFHSSMLVHTTQSTEIQLTYRPAIETFLGDLLSEFESDPTPMQRFYESTLAHVPSDVVVDQLSERVASWDEVILYVEPVLRRLIQRTPAGPEFKEDGRTQQAHSGVIVDNSKVDWRERLTYSDMAAGQPGIAVIAIGGNTLSRGLTLEGLVCSYFARTARTYDSLMQMGRWFGYRNGYRHLQRIWTTQLLLDWFGELDLVERELREELIWMEENGWTPAQYGPRIRVSPSMNITRASAMRSLTKHVSYSDYLLDQAWLDLDTTVLHTNQRVATELAESMPDSDPAIEPSKLFRDVPVASVRTFLQNFRFHSLDKRIDAPTLLGYLDQEVGNGRLTTWNVMFKSLKRSASQFDFGGSVGTVQAVRRARTDNLSIAHIQSLVDSGDHRIDMGGAEPPSGVKYRGDSEPPLLVVYAVDPQSQPEGRSKRLPLNAAMHPIGVSIAFPRSESAVDYVAPALADPIETDLGDYEQ